jgi:hypothetical protein
MATVGPDSPGYLKLWKRAAIAVLWLVGPVLMGILAASMMRRTWLGRLRCHRTVRWSPRGDSYLLLPLLSPLRKLGGWGRVVAYTVAAILPTVVCAAYVALSDPRSAASFFFFMSGVAAGFACICAVLCDATRIPVASLPGDSSRSRISCRKPDSRQGPIRVSCRSSPGSGPSGADRR